MSSLPYYGLTHLFVCMHLWMKLDICLSVPNSLSRMLIILKILAGSNQQVMTQYMLHPQMEPSVAQTWRLEFHHL